MVNHSNRPDCPPTIMPVSAWKLIHGLSVLFGFGHRLFETVDCGGKGYLRLLQEGEKSKKTSSFWG